MLILTVICGVILMLGGFSCLFHPAATFFETGYFMTILLLVYGIIGIVRVIQKKSHPLELIPSVLAVIFGIIAIFRPGTTLLMDGVMAYLFAAWFVIQGLISIYVSIKVKGIKKGWYWGLIIGIIALLLGIYSFFHPMVSAVTIGILVGIYLIETGLNMIILATAVTPDDNQQ